MRAIIKDPSLWMVIIGVGLLILAVNLGLRFPW